MAGLEVENFSQIPVERDPAAEDIASLKPADEHGGIRFRNAERLRVHFLAIEEELLRDSVGYGMGGGGGPHPALLVGFPPAKAARCSQKAHEGF